MKAATGRCRVQPLPAAKRLRVAIGRRAGAAATACVAEGESVRAGQLIGRIDADGAVPVHAPTSGCVTGIVRVETLHACDVPAVEIEPDGRNDWASSIGQHVEPGDLTSLADCVRRAGITGPDGEAMSMAHLLLEAAERGVQHVIINGMESEPYLTAEYRIMAEHGRTIVRAAERIAACVGAQRAALAVDRANRHLVAELNGLVQDTPVRVLPLPNKYPQGAVPLLVRRVLGREIPYAGTPLDVGAIVLDVSTTLAIGRAAFEGRPCVSRIITVSGDAASLAGNYDVPFGTPIHGIIEHVGLRRTMARVVLGGAMTGQAITSLGTVTTSDVRAVLLLSKARAAVRRPGPCIRCGWCLEDCPVGLDPPSLLAAVEGDLSPKDRAAEIAALYPHACLGCGICSYVCPVGLSLAEGVPPPPPPPPATR